MSDWTNVCEALWGADWMQPAAEVLRVNRRTIERWRAGEQTIPPHIAAELVRLPRLGSAQRAYGEALRRLANGTSIDDIDSDARDNVRAAKRLRADLGKFSSIAVLAHGDSNQE